MSEPSPDGEPPRTDPSPRRTRPKWDIAATLILLAALFGFMLLLLVAIGFLPYWDWVNCSIDPQDCNLLLYDAANRLVWPGLSVLYVATAVISIVLLVRRTRAYLVPVFGAGAMIVCAVIAAMLLGAAKL
ncbi:MULTISPECIES: DUF6264 family protein [Microbacterium]|uniref:DUF6264 family protein n=1 Tax=Microbacterium TaxID=33882 RepID=UPI000D64F868|nr:MULTISPECIES: DUF6264 family protein [Microbacterium]